MDEKFNHEESLSLINEMINRAQNNVKKEKTYSMIYWGYVTAVAAVINCVLLHTLNDPKQSFWIWSVTIPAGIVSYFIERRFSRENFVKTHIDKIFSKLWVGYNISAAVIMVVLFSVAFKFEMHLIFFLVTPVILAMVGMAQFATACIFRSKMWYAIAALFWVGAIVCAFLTTGMRTVSMQFAVFAVCMILGYIVPGHIMNRQAKKNNV